MTRKIYYGNIYSKLIAPIVLIASIILTLLVSTSSAQALTPIPPPDPKPGSFGLEATKTQAPPAVGATITTPGGGSFSNSPITVGGICPDGLLVQIYNNNVMVGAVMCSGGSFAVEVSLFAGVNELKAIVYDDLEQAGPESNIVSVTYTDTSFSAFGEQMTLTSSYGRRSAPVNDQLDWPLQLAGGTGPYAFSIDWGDGSDAQLMSLSLAGLANIQHVYKRAGIYQVNVRATDVNGVSAFLQLVAVSSGQVDAATGQGEVAGEGKTRVIILWLPAALSAILLFPAYWLGRRSQLVSLRNKMEKERDNYIKKKK